MYKLLFFLLHCNLLCIKLSLFDFYSLRVHENTCNFSHHNCVYHQMSTLVREDIEEDIDPLAGDFDIEEDDSFNDEDVAKDFELDHGLTTKKRDSSSQIANNYISTSKGIEKSEDQDKDQDEDQDKDQVEDENLFSPDAGLRALAETKTSNQEIAGEQSTTVKEKSDYDVTDLLVSNLITEELDDAGGLIESKPWRKKNGKERQDNDSVTTQDEEGRQEQQKTNNNSIAKASSSKIEDTLNNIEKLLDNVEDDENRDDNTNQEENTEKNFTRNQKLNEISETEENTKTSPKDDDLFNLESVNNGNVSVANDELDDDLFALIEKGDGSEAAAESSSDGFDFSKYLSENEKGGDGGGLFG